MGAILEDHNRQRCRGDGFRIRFRQVHPDLDQGGGQHEKDQQQENDVRQRGHAEFRAYLVPPFESHV